MTKLIPLNRGLFAQIDDEDFERVSQYRWYACRARSSRDAYYVRGGPKGQFMLHRFILGLQTGEICDHADRDGLNNCKSNLRRCSHSQNCANRRTENKWGRGVGFNAPKRRWQARIRVNGIAINLGNFGDPVSAARAYDAKAREIFGEFATLNFPAECAL